MKQKSKIHFDYIFLFAILALNVVGTLMIFSASPTMGLKIGDTYFFIKRHLFFLFLGLFAFYGGLRCDLMKLKKWSGLLLMITVFLLFAVYIPGVGRKISGASRWIDLFFISFQPSELMKFVMIVFLANALTQSHEKIRDFFNGLLPLLVLVGFIAGIIVLQPDLGTALVISGTAFILFFVAGAQLSHLAMLGGAGVLGVAVLSFTSHYRLHRLLAFIDPWKDPQGIGFHIIQSLLAVGSGGIFGLGLGASRQKFFYLPQQFTDFIFAILCEELGFIGGIFVAILYAILLGRGLRIATRTTDSFNSLLTVGIVSWIIIQATLNIMVVLGMIPTTGIPLPFISFGGTAVVLQLFSVGLVLQISRGEAVAK
jgi:cell division protein FtsW